MAARTIARLYDSYDDASQVVSALETSGIPHSDISIVSNDARHRPADAANRDHSGTGAATGASLGTILGGGAGLLAGIGALAIPGVGPVVAAGWLIATLTGAGVGAAAGGLIGGLTGAGVSEDEANVYGEGVRRGGTLVTVRTDDTQADRVQSIMQQHNPVDWQTRGAEYRQSGWNRFDPNADPYGATGTVPTATGTAVGGPTIGTTTGTTTAAVDADADRLSRGGRL